MRRFNPAEVNRRAQRVRIYSYSIFALARSSPIIF